MNSFPCMMYHLNHQSKPTTKEEAGRTVFSGGAMNLPKMKEIRLGYAVMAVCATIAKTIHTVDLA